MFLLFLCEVSVSLNKKRQEYILTLLERFQIIRSDIFQMISRHYVLFTHISNKIVPLLLARLLLASRSTWQNLIENLFAVLLKIHYISLFTYFLPTTVSEYFIFIFFVSFIPQVLILIVQVMKLRRI